MDAQFFSLQSLLEQWYERVLPWHGLPRIAGDIADENNQ